MSAVSSIEILDIVIHGDETDTHVRHEDWNTGGMENGALMVRFNVDGESFDVVQVDPARQTDLEILDRAIASLTMVRERLTAVYEGVSA
jgi:hypothetical protein